MSEQDQWDALMGSNDEGPTFFVDKGPETGVTVVLSDAEKAEIARKNQIGDDLDKVSARADTDHLTSRASSEERANAEQRLNGENIFVGRYLLDGLEEASRTNPHELGQRRAKLRNIVDKMREGKDLTADEKEIADRVGINETVIVVKKEEEVEVPAPVQTGPARVEAPRVAALTPIERRVDNIEKHSNTTIKEQRDTLERLRVTLMNQGLPQSDIDVVQRALDRLNIRENEEIHRYESSGAMRPEVAAVLAKFNEDLRKAYEGNGILINTATNTLQEGQLKVSLEDLRSRGSDGKALAERLEREVLSIAILHDLRMKVDRNSPVTEMMDLAVQLNGTNFNNLLHLEDRTPEKRNDPRGNDYVLRCLVAIDEEARTVYRDGTGKRAFSLQDPTLKARIMNLTGGSELYYSIARDLYRVTGGEARYSVASYAHQDPARNGAWVIERVEDGGGTVFRKALNGRRESYGSIRKDPPYYTTYNPLLLSHIDPAVTSFWEGLWSKAKKEPGANVSVFGTQKETVLNTDAENGIPTREYAVLSLEALRNLNLGDSTEFGYNKWLESMGNSAESMGKESKFMLNPSFAAFKATFGEEYKYTPRFRNGRALEKNEYFLERLDDFVRYSLSIGTSRSAISAELDKYCEGPNIFASQDELDNFKNKHKIPTNSTRALASDATELGEMLFDPDSKRNRKSAWGVIGGFLGGLTGLGGKN